MNGLIASIQGKQLMVIAIVLSGASCVISLVLIFLFRKLFNSHVIVRSTIEKFALFEGNKTKSASPEKQPISPIESLLGEADIIRNTIRKYITMYSEDRTDRQKTSESVVINDLEERVSKYMEQMSVAEDSLEVQKILSDYIDRLRKAFPVSKDASKLQKDVISLNAFIEEFPQFLSTKPGPFSGVLHAYFSYLINQYITPLQKSISSKSGKPLDHQIAIIERHIIRDIIEQIDRIRWDKKNTADRTVIELKRFEETVLNPILSRYQITELPTVPGKTLVDVRIHDVLGKRDADLPMGTVLGVYRRGYRYVDPETNNSRIIKKAAVYIAG